MMHIEPRRLSIKKAYQKPKTSAEAAAKAKRRAENPDLSGEEEEKGGEEMSKYEVLN